MLAWLTVRFVEKPLRFGGDASKKTRSLFVLMLLLVITGLAVNLLVRPIYVNRDGMLDCAEGTLCEFGNPQATKTILLYGDSHAAHFSKALSETMGDRYHFLYVTVSGCFLGDQVKFIATKGDIHRKDCDAGLAVLRSLAGKKIFAVIRAQRWHSYAIDQEPDIKSAVLDGIDSFGIIPQKTVILGSTDDIDTKCYQVKKLKLLLRRRQRCLEYPVVKKQNKSFIAVTQQLKVPGNVKFVYPYLRFCPNDRCKARSAGSWNFEDRHHLSLAGARKVMPDIISAIEN